MIVHPGDRVFVTWPIAGVPVDATVELSVNGAAWGPIPRPTPDTVRALLDTPGAPDDAAAATVTASLAAGRNTWALRVSDSPEVLVSSGVIYVTA